jgi:sterol desaturase/sphingolipid hydroxylase (fatty acid hydroxylase superfamily)
MLNLRICLLYMVLLVAFVAIADWILGRIESVADLGFVDLRFQSDGGIAAQLGAGILLLFIGDFFFYWQHRCQHAIPFLWSLHSVHHSDRHVNAVSANRHHWTEQLIRNLFVVIPMAMFFKLNRGPTGLLGLFLQAEVYFIHSNIRLNLGPFTKFIVGPQIHRIHHSRLPAHFDKNFAGMFPLWDLLFGTYYHPERDEFPPTGIEGEEIRSLREAIHIPFSRRRSS